MKITWSCVNGSLGYTVIAKAESQGANPWWFREPLGQIDHLTAGSKRALIEWAVQHLEVQARSHLK